MISKDSFNHIFANKQKVLVIMAHPDDAELYAGGTIARLIKAGKRVRVVKMTLGNKGCKQKLISEKELEKIRLKEDQKAMETLGIKKEDNVYLGLEDGGIECDLENIGKIVRQIRLFKPEIIITHNPEDIIIRFAKDINWVNHRDHLNTGKITINAAYPYSRDLLFFPEQFKEKDITSWTVTEFLLVDYYKHPDMVHIEMTDFAETRSQAHAAHISQYSLKDAKNSTDFFTKHPSGKRLERFRYIIAD